MKNSATGAQTAIAVYLKSLLLDIPYRLFRMRIRIIYGINVANLQKNIQFCLESNKYFSTAPSCPVGVTILPRPCHDPVSSVSRSCLSCVTIAPQLCHDRASVVSRSCLSCVTIVSRACLVRGRCLQWLPSVLIGCCTNWNIMHLRIYQSE